MLSWLAYSDHERDKALDLVALLREREARDELGLGTIRDTISDLLFPGTSTLHTRARYFLFIPRIYAALEQKGLTASELQARGRKAEIRLSESLLASGETDGVIGKLAGRELKRLASSVYWNGLRTWRVSRQATAPREYFRAAAISSRRASLIPDGDAFELGRPTFWDASLPDGEDGQSGNVSFRLTRTESRYLAQKISDHHSDSLLRHLLDREQSALAYDAPWFWAGDSALPADRRRELQHARMFSELSYGSVLLYNLLLSETSNNRSRVEEYRQRLSAHELEMADRNAAIASWSERDFWAMVDDARRRLPSATPISQSARQFCISWFALIMDEGAAKLADSKAGRRLVTERERSLKGRLARVSGGRPLDLWQGASGIHQLNFRWTQVKRVMSDIRLGLGVDDA